MPLYSGIYNAKFIHNAKFSPMRSAFALKEDRANLILPTRSTSDFFLTSKSTARLKIIANT
uniref:Uncharacterized protein n=1 Tax=Wuchereria bancrofti TaxID=6293 RepID=A0A1I8EZG6_WUCBA